MSKEKIINIFQQTPSSSSLIQRIQATKQLLVQDWEERMVRMSKNPKVIDRILSLPEELQYRFFGEQITEETQASLQNYALRYLRIQYGRVKRDIINMNWIDLPTLFNQLFKAFTKDDYQYKNQSYYNVDEVVVLLYLKNQFVEKISMPQMKFLLIDEVQDYNSAQILLLNKLFPRSQFTMVGDENQSIFNSHIRFDKIIEHFDSRPAAIQLYNLLNSYRSSGSITKLFSQLALNNDQWEIVPIRPEGDIPIARKTVKTSELIEFITEIQKKINQQILTIITKTDQQANELYSQIGKDQLQALNCEILPITLSKGLEFDHVLIYQVSEDNYHNQRDKRILYTAASRAMKNLFVNYSNSISSLLAEGSYIESKV
ncbi:UvrD-helicase domain-containing protein [Aerococcaceae bacterium WGS1372]